MEHHVGKILRHELIQAYLRAKEQSAGTMTKEDILNRIHYDLPKATQLCGRYMSGWVYEPVLSGMFSVTVLLLVDWRICLLCVICSFVNLWPAGLFVKQSERMNQELAHFKNDLIRFMNEMLEGGTEVRVFRLQAFFQEKLSDHLGKVKEDVIKRERYQYLRRFSTSFYADCIIVVTILVLGALLARQNVVSFSDVMLALPLSDQINQMIAAFRRRNVLLKETVPYLRRLDEILSLPEGNAIFSAEESERITLSGKNLSFSHQGKPILNDVSIAFPEGSKTAIVGRSGSGKSTLLKILAGIYEPEKGTVCLKENKRLLYMPQDNGLLMTNLAGNISLSTEAEMEAVMKNLKSAEGAHLISQVPGKEILLRNGKNFSGGEVQKIALARTLNQNADILLLDEPSSAIDIQSAHAIFQNLLHETEKTIIVVTHQPELVKDFEQIFAVTNDGRVERVMYDTAKNHSAEWS